MKKLLLTVLKIIHALVWFPFSSFVGTDFPQRFLRRKTKS